MRITILLLIVSCVLAGCATRFGKLPDGREYKEYDVKFNKDKAKFEVPLQNKEEFHGLKTRME